MLQHIVYTRFFTGAPHPRSRDGFSATEGVRPLLSEENALQKIRRFLKIKIRQSSTVPTKNQLGDPSKRPQLGELSNVFHEGVFLGVFIKIRARPIGTNELRLLNLD